MVIDIRTIILIIGIVHLMQVLVFSYQYYVNKNLSGPGWWLIWSACEFLGFWLILLRVIPFLLTAVIVFQNVIILSGTIFVYIGIMRFFGKKENLKFIVPFFSSYVILHLYFLFVNNSIEIRTFLLDVSLSLVAFLTATSIYKNKKPSIASTAVFNTSLFAVHGFVFAFQSVMILSGVSVTEVFKPSLFNVTQYFDALLAGLLWTFGFIMMLNQKLNRDITEAKSHFEQIFNTSPDAVVISRLSDGQFVDCNEGYTKISGYTKEDISGKSSIDINIWKNQGDRHEVIKIIEEKGFCENIEIMFHLKNGEEITGLMSAKVITLNGVPHIISVTRDISDRKRMEVALQESEKNYRLLFQNLTTGFALHEILTNADGQPFDYRFLEVNPAFETLTGLRSSDLIGKTTMEVLPKTEPFWIETYGQVALTGKPITIENYSIEFDKYYQVHAYSPDPGKFATIFLDVTNQKQYEAEIHKKNDELHKLNAEKDKFFSIIAHDLRGPFSSFMGLTQIMDKELSGMTMNMIQEITLSLKNSATNLYQLLENLLQWAQMQQGLISFNQEAILLSSVIDVSIAVLLEPAKNKGIEFTSHISDGLVVFADSYVLQTVIRNLVSNAIKFTLKGGKITLSAKATSDKSIEISVQDTGIGMNQTIINNLFRIDFQTNRLGTEGEPSTGIGLLLCKEFVEKQGGQMWVESEVGIGSAFYFTIPYKE